MAEAPGRKLFLVSSASPLPDPPYPSEARAKGWRLELDLERAKSSDTWGICPPEIRPWLLMMWAEAWLSVPCGTLSNDDAVIAGRIGMPINLFRAHRDVLMRNWSLCSDGRLYHHVLTERITALLQMRHRENTRIKEWRDRQNKENQESVNQVTRNTTVGSPVGPGPGPGSKDLELSLSLSSPPGDRAKRATPAACPVRKIVATFNERCPSCPQSKVPTKALHEHISARWRQLFIDGAASNAAEAGQQFADFFDRVQASDFLAGRTKGSNGRRPMRASLRWLMNPENFAKVIEGEYDNR